jgi:hypothetical protein
MDQRLLKIMNKMNWNETFAMLQVGSRDSD